MTLSRRQPRDLTSPRDLLATFISDPFFRPGWFDEPFGAASIPLDIFQEDDAVRVKASVPGMKADALHVEVDDDTLRIWGEAEEEEKRKDDAYYLQERRYGRLERAVRLPYRVDGDGARAEFENGVLNLTLPKATGANRKEIEVQTRS